MIDLATVTREELLRLSDEQLSHLHEQIDDGCEQSLRKYCPHKPWPKQRLFLDLKCKEAFFGGAVGGSKTDTLLMVALQYVHVPGYSCLILRRDYARLSLPGSIMDRARSWLFNTDAKWNDQKKLFRFPSGAVIQFGYIDHPDDRFRYASSEFQAILWDELSEFKLSDDESNPYLFLFSRLRKPDELPVPLIVRAASNPGNIGHAWVRKRFVSDAAIAALNANTDASPRVYWADESQTIAFVPSLLQDNPAINPDDYLPSLAHLPPITRARLIKGDWSVREDGLIQPSWPLRYRVSGDGVITVYDASGGVAATWNETASYRFQTCDPAGTSADKARSSRGHDHSWSVIQTWDRAPADVGPFIVLRDNQRVRVSFTGLLDELRAANDRWSPARVRIENEKLGLAAQELLRDEIPIDTVPTGGKDKVSRASVLLQKLERGEVALPQSAPWLESLEAEWFSWTGHPEETSDQIDAAAYAAMESQGRGLGIWSPELFGPYAWLDKYPTANLLAVCVRPVDADDIGQAKLSAIVYAGVSGDGRIYLDCVLSDGNVSQLLESLRVPEATFGATPKAIVTVEEYLPIVRAAVEQQYQLLTLPPDLLVADPKQCEYGKPEALTPLITDRMLRFHQPSAACRALVNRMKAYPHTDDHYAIQAVGLAIETLATLGGPHDATS